MLKRTINQILRRFFSTNPIKAFNDNKRNIRPNGFDFRKLYYIIPVTTFGLGTWQVQRRREKMEIIKLLEDRLNAEPRELPKDLKQLKDLEYYKFTVKGKFDHSKEIIMQPRTRLDQDKPPGGLIGGRNQFNGAWVITPFKLSDRHYSILVNRGWIPKTRIDQNRRKESLIEDEITLTGILRLTEKRSQFSMKNRPEQELWNYRDVELMAFTRDSAPVFLDAVKEPNSNNQSKSMPIGGQTKITLRNEHLNYIITWYSLSLLTFLLTRKLLKVKKN